MPPVPDAILMMQAHQCRLPDLIAQARLVLGCGSAGAGALGDQLQGPSWRKLDRAFGTMDARYHERLWDTLAYVISGLKPAAYANLPAVTALN